MGYVLAFFAVIAGFVLYAYLCLLVVEYISAPLALVAVLLGLPTGLLLMIVATLAVLSGQSQREKIIGPSSQGRGRPPASKQHDPAWRTYFSRQVAHDYVAAFWWCMAMVFAQWTWVVRVLRKGRWYSAASWPLVLPVLVWLIAMSTGAFVGLGFVAGAVGAVTLIAWSIGLLVVGLLRSVDVVWRRVLHTAPTCPNAGCNRVSPLPYFRCPGLECGTLHRDLRPSRLGILWRRCVCGTRMPTMVLRTGSLHAVCPGCMRDLHAGAGIATDVSVPVFGAPQAGKSRFLMSALVSLFDLADNGRVTLTKFGDENTLELYRSVLSGTGSVPKTPERPPPALTIRVEAAHRSALVHVFDAAGEQFGDRAQNEQLRYLETARGLAFILDPFSIPRIRDELVLRPDLLPTTVHDPWLSYRVTVQRLRDCGAPTRSQSLAFVVSKSDLLTTAPLIKKPDPMDVSVQQWLQEVGLDDLVRECQRDFRTVRFFLTSSLRPEPNRPDGSLAVFSWLLGKQDVQLHKWVVR